MSERTLVHGSLYLFIDLITVALGAWIFWFVISKFATPAEIGFATTTISLITLIGGFALLGLDYSLLRESRNPGVFPTILIFELGLLAILSPIVFVIGSAIYGADFNSFMILGVIYFVSLGLQITSTFCILGLLKSQYVLLAHTIGTASRFAVGILLVFWGFGGLGILWAMIVQSLIIGIILTAISLRKVGFHILSFDQLKQVLKLGLSNLPNRVAQLTIASLSVVILAIFTSNPETVGIYFIALMVSLIAGGFAGSLATMSIPTSSLKGQDFTKFSLRYGLGLTAPLIAILLIAPSSFLSLIGEQYVRGALQLQILSLAVIPSTIVLNAIAKLNFQKSLHRLIIIGLTQLTSFLIASLLLVSQYDAVGISWAVLVSSIITAIVSLRTIGRVSIRPVTISVTAMIIGWLIGSQLVQISLPVGILSGFAAASAIILLSKLVRIRELIEVIRSTSYRPVEQN